MFNAPQRNALYNLVGEGVEGERAPIQLNFFRRGECGILCESIKSVFQPNLLFWAGRRLLYDVLKVHEKLA